MHDVNNLLDEESGAAAGLARRGYHLDTEALGALVKRRAGTRQLVDSARGEVKRLAKQATNADAGGVHERARRLRAELRTLEADLEQVQRELADLLHKIPNVPAADAPNGSAEDDAVVVRHVGTPADRRGIRDHLTLGEAMGILDPRRASKLSGSRFSVCRGAGARLERALAAFLLDLHTTEHGYVEYSLPAMVTRQTMTGTGQLPKFEEDLLRTSVADRELFLIPTAEVPLTNLFAGETLDRGGLPLAVTAHTECFRGEAGSYGRDTRGILRLHQFGKVELVRICPAEHAERELAVLVEHAEECLRRLGLVYRVVQLAAGDLGFSARRTYDLEVWLPSQDRYREVSSCSDCGTFQARRAGIKVRGPGTKPAFAATLNGSGLPIGRTMVAILEQCQDEHGAVILPEALVPYAGFGRINPDGTTR